MPRYCGLLPITKLVIFSFFGSIQSSSYKCSSCKASEVCKEDKIKNITVHHGQIEASIFEDYKHLYNITIRNTNISSMKSDAFRQLGWLRCLDLGFNQITEIPAETFTNFQYLRTIILQNNKILLIGERAFANLPVLSWLILTFNRLKELSENSFFCVHPRKLIDNSLQLFLSGNMIGPRIMGSSQIFRSLPHLTSLLLQNNCIKTITKLTFQNLTWLINVDLSHNNPLHVEKGSFTPLGRLLFLILTNTSIKLHKEIFFGLKSLITLNLSTNKICHIDNATFQHLSSLRSLFLTDNALKDFNINVFFVTHSPFCICLTSNKLTRINKEMFTGLTDLVKLHLNRNNIQTVDIGSFKHLFRLKELYLHENNLTCLNKYFIVDMVSLKFLNLAYNSLHTIADSAFVRKLFLTTFLLIDLRGNNITNLSWLIHTNTSANSSIFKIAKQSGSAINMHIDPDKFVCSRHLCWVKQWFWSESIPLTVLNPAFWHMPIGYHIDHFNLLRSRNLKTKCSQRLAQICPSEGGLPTGHTSQFVCFQNKMLCFLDKRNGDCFERKTSVFCPVFIASTGKWCMQTGSTSCNNQCSEIGREPGQLVTDPEVCPFKFFCKCACPDCVKQCVSEGKVFVKQTTDMFGCHVCNCKCEQQNCGKICSKEQSFSLQNNSFGCPRCVCGCPYATCDPMCHMAGPQYAGCIECEGCNNTGSGGKYQYCAVLYWCEPPFKC